MTAIIKSKQVDSFLSRVQDAGCDHDAPGCAAIAARWKELNATPGDIVLLCLPNGKPLLAHYFGAISAGLVPALLAPNTPSARISEIGEAMGARASVATRVRAGTFARVELICGATAMFFKESLEPAALPGEAILVTSGTSGFSSGCVFDFSALLLNAERHAGSIGQTAQDVLLINLPLQFSFALVAQALSALVTGSRLIVSGPPFHATSYLREVRRHGVTVSSLTPMLARAVLLEDHVRLDSVRALTVGGDAIPSDCVAPLLALRPGRELYLTYGLTEAGPRVSTLAAHEESPDRYASVGRPLPGTSVRLRPAKAIPGACELVVSSDTVMKRRIGRIDGRRSNHTGPGAVATGDLFEQDRDGYLYFKGRISDYILRDGEKVCLAAVRRIASGLPEVVTARTPVSQDRDDYKLELIIKGRPSTDMDYAHLLRGWLRRSEMPSDICVVFEKHREAAYK